MQINLDPTRWMVSLVGFVVDWVLSREWKRIALNSIPLMFLAIVGVLVFLGSRLDKHRLATRYLALGEKEIADWEQSWAPSKPTEGSAEKEDTAEDKAEKTEKKELSRFAEVLFRRVQLLEPNERSQFVIGVTMAQRGATTQAEKMLSKIAPDNRPGYGPAHAWIAQNLFRQPITDQNVRQLKHHVKEAVKWERVPESLLLVGSELFLSLREPEECLNLLKRAAELNPANSLFLAQRSAQFGNKLLAEQSSTQAESYFRSELERDPNNIKSRLGLVQTLLVLGKLSEAEQIVRDGMQIEPSPALSRALSEVFRIRYLASCKQDGNTWSGDLQMLDAAMRIDPTNSLVGEEIAKLARFNGELPNNELIEKLQNFLAEGKATAATHAWIAESYLIRGKYADALPHLEQVVSRLPNSAQFLNNLAFVLVELDPKRREDALAFAQRAVQIEQDRKLKSDYYDTLAKVLASLNRRTEAVTALESAIELQPTRKDFHEGISALYESTGNLPMAERHRAIALRIAENEQLAQAAKEAESKVPETQQPATQETATKDTATPEPAAEVAPPTDAPVENPAAETPKTETDK